MKSIKIYFVPQISLIGYYWLYNFFKKTHFLTLFFFFLMIGCWYSLKRSDFTIQCHMQRLFNILLLFIYSISTINNNVVCQVSWSRCIARQRCKLFCFFRISLFCWQSQKTNKGPADDKEKKSTSVNKKKKKKSYIHIYKIIQNPFFSGRITTGKYRKMFVQLFY